MAVAFRVNCSDATELLLNGPPAHPDWNDVLSGSARHKRRTGGLTGKQPEPSRNRLACAVSYNTPLLQVCFAAL